MATLVNQYGQPISTGRHIPRPSLEAGRYSGTIANWRPGVVATAADVAYERELTQRRAADLYANDWAARSGLRSVADHAIGTGLTPRSIIPHKILGIGREEAAAIGELMEWAFTDWALEAHAAGIAHFQDLQYLGLLSILRLGEMIHLPVMLRDSGRKFSLAIQNISPARLQTPADKTLDTAIRDGVELSPSGKPIAYWIACPPANVAQYIYPNNLLSTEFQRRLARIGHRPNIFHLFRLEEDEQVRGISALACGMKLYRNLNDCLDSELFAQVIAASFPVFIELENGAAQLPDAIRESYGYGAYEGERIQEVEAGTITYGAPGERPHVLESNRPSSNFGAFEVTIKRAMAAALGIPYESLSKDFSKTNYSSMRAALNESWKLYNFYRQWFSRLYTQPIWEMVIEEAYLRNYLGLADAIDGVGATLDFYAGRQYWTSANWIGPAKGFIDPVKEIQATILALQNRLATYGEAWAERGGDFDDALPIMRDEAEQMADLAPGNASFGNYSGENDEKSPKNGQKDAEYGAEEDNPDADQ